MTQEDHLDSSHQASNSVCYQVNDDTLTNNNSKNKTANCNQKLNGSDDGVNCVSSEGSNMGAAAFVAPKENESIGPSDQLQSSSLSPAPSEVIGNKDKDHLLADGIIILNTANETTIAAEAAGAAATVSSEEEFQQHSPIGTDRINGDIAESSKMTVIKSQNNSENIREIQMKIEDADKSNNTDGNSTTEEKQNQLESDDKKLNEVKDSIQVQNDQKNSEKQESNDCNKLEKINEEKSENKKENLISIKSDNEQSVKGSKRRSKERSVSQDTDDPIARLNALRANISNALREVKAVLSEHGEPVTPEKPIKDEKNDSPNENGIVNFRFVRKVRRRSTFDDDNAITEIVVNQIVNDKQDADAISDENSKPLETKQNPEKLIETISEEQSVEKNVQKVESDHSSETKILDSKDEIQQENIENQKTTEQNGQAKKLVKKNSPKTKKVKEGTESNGADDKKPAKTKKLIKRNSQDDSLKASSTPSTETQASDEKIKTKTNITTDPTVDTKKTVKKSQGVKASSKATVGNNALDKVLEITNSNSKTPTIRRASIATAKVSGQDSKPSLEKRRSSTSRVMLKSKQMAATIEKDATSTESSDLKKSESIQKKPETELKVGDTATLSSERQSENLSEKVKIDKGTVKASTKEETIVKSVEGTDSKITAPSIPKGQISTSAQGSSINKLQQEKMEKENTPKPLVQQDNQISSIEKNKDVSPSNSKSSAVEQSKNDENVSNLKTSVTVQTTKPSGENQKPQSLNKQEVAPSINNVPEAKIDSKLSDGVKSKDMKSSQTQTTSKPPVEISKSQTPPATQVIPITQSALLPQTTTIPQTAPSPPQQSEVSKTNEEKESLEMPSDDSSGESQTNSKSPVVRNAITAKLAELKRPPYKMAVIPKPNLEVAKIHPLMVLHITPPKNLSVITPKTPQKATVSKSTVKSSKESKDSSNENENSEDENTETTEDTKKPASGKGKRKSKKKVVIRRVKRKLSLDTEEKLPETEIEEKEIEPKTPEPPTESNEPEKPLGKKSCLKVRVYEPGELVMYADRIKKTFKWRKATVLEKITSISYKLDVEGDEKSAHICYMKKYTDKKVKFGGKEYLEIDYADYDDSDEEEEVYNIWARV